jgi:hypothetical protein
MRNECAHNVHGSTMDSGKIKDLLTNLTTSSSIVRGHKELTFYPPGNRGDLLKIANIILFHLNSLVESPNSARPLSLCPEEWIYSWVYQKPAPKNSNSQLPAGTN